MILIIFKVDQICIVAFRNRRIQHDYSGGNYDHPMLSNSTISKMQKQYWVTKQTVYKKFGKKEDECVVASDSELDAKLELYRSIQQSCYDLQRIIERYQEKTCSKLTIFLCPYQNLFILKALFLKLPYRAL
jgi:Arfaptin-like domain